MEKILITASEAVVSLGFTPSKFLRLLDSGKALPEFEDGNLRFDLHQLKKLSVSRPEGFGEAEFYTVRQTLFVLGISRRTFYNRVNDGLIRLHKYKSSSYVKKSELYADDELF